MLKDYNFYSDDGHGWLAVKRSEVNALGLQDKISNYSYQKGNTVYLEEDSDTSLFINTKVSLGDTIRFNEVYHRGQSWIRGLEHYASNVVYA